MKHASKLTLLVLNGLLASIACAAGADHASPAVGADAALAKLKQGNAQYAAARVTAGKPTAARRAETAQAQHPFAIVVACADSRTPPELVFDQNLGDLFVVRTAGNLVDTYALGSIEYAVEHLGSRLIVVLGHERCGAVKAAMATCEAPGHVDALVKAIQPAVAAAKGRAGDPTDATIVENTRLVAAKIAAEAKLGAHAKDVRIVQAVYDLDTGTVEWLK